MNGLIELLALQLQLVEEFLGQAGLGERFAKRQASREDSGVAPGRVSHGGGVAAM